MRRARRRRLPLLDRLAAGAARRAPARSTRRGLDFYDRLVDGCWSAGSGRSPRSTTGTCRRPCRTAAAGRSATPPSASPSTPRVVAERARRPRSRDWITAQRAAVLGLARPPGGHAWRPGSRTWPTARARVAPPAARPRPGRRRCARRAAAGRRSASCSTSAPCEPATDRRRGPAARRARTDGHTNRWWLDPVCTARLPGGHARRSTALEPAGACATATWTRSPRRSTCSGVNYYFRQRRRRRPDRRPRRYARQVAGARRADDRDGLGGRPRRPASSCYAAAPTTTGALPHLRHRERLGLPTTRSTPTARSTTRERIAYLRRPPRRLRPRGRRRRRRWPATSSGRCWTTSSGRTATTSASAWSTSTTTPRRRTPKDSALLVPRHHRPRPYGRCELTTGHALLRPRHDARPRVRLPRPASGAEPRRCATGGPGPLRTSRGSRGSE